MVTTDGVKPWWRYSAGNGGGRQWPAGAAIGIHGNVSRRLLDRINGGKPAWHAEPVVASIRTGRPLQ